MKIYRGTKGMANIYAGKDIAFKNTGFKPLKDDKWNPGDIWAIDKSFSLKELNYIGVPVFITSERIRNHAFINYVHSSAKKYLHNVKFEQASD